MRSASGLRKGAAGGEAGRKDKDPLPRETSL